MHKRRISLETVAIVLAVELVGCPDITPAFLSTIHIRNDSSIDLFITPLGSGERSHSYRALPRYERFGTSFTRARQQTRILLRSGTTLTYTYDTDDFNFRFLLLRAAVGDPRLLHTDFPDQVSHPCCFGPQQTLYVIPPLLTKLPIAPAGIDACEQGNSVPSELLRPLYPRGRGAA